MSKLIPEESPLRRLPQTLKPSQCLIIDGIRYSIEITELAYIRLMDTLIKISQSNKGEVPEDSFTSTLADVWTIIDSVNRLRSLITLLPDSDKADYVQTFLDKTEKIKKLRNSIQHLHARFDKLLSLKQSTWGTLSWITLDSMSPISGRIHTLVAGSILQQYKYPIPNPVGENFRAPLDVVVLNAHGFSIRIVDLYDDVATFITVFQKVLVEQFKGLPHPGCEMYIVQYFKHKTNDNKKEKRSK